MNVGNGMNMNNMTMHSMNVGNGMNMNNMTMHSMNGTK
jgi:hypothetical protein